MSALALQERRTVVAKLGAEGLTAAAIARRVGAPYQTVINDAKVARVDLVKPDDWWGREGRVETLRRLHAELVPYPEIAKQLGCSLTKAKSKAARLKLPARTEAGKRRVEKPAKPAPAPRVEPPRISPFVIIYGHGIPLMKAEAWACKWPSDLIAEGVEDVICCGALVRRPKPGERPPPYCPGHMAVAFYPPKPGKGRTPWKG